MKPDLPSAPNRKDTRPGLYDHMGVYGPFVWVMDWVVIYMLRLGMRAGFISPEFLMPSRPKIKPDIIHRNRQLRRARSSCLRRARRHLLKGRKINPEDYTPRAYAHYDYIDRMDKTITPAQFREHYIRDNNLSRVQVYELDHAHEVTGFILGSVGDRLSKFVLNFFGQSPLNLGVVSDPAPP